MAFDGTAPRADITYLRRRVRREAPKVAAVAELSLPTPPGGLSLSHPGRPPIGTHPAPSHADSSSPGASLNRSAPSAQAPAPRPTAPSGGSSLDLSPPATTAAPIASAPAATATPAANAADASVGSLLSLGATVQPAAAQTPPKPPSRRVSGRVLLSADEPTVTLDRRQSALGSLVFEVDGPGAVAALWEMPDGTTGLVDEVERTRTSPEFGRRPIVELHQTHIVVGLRHVQQLRRLLILMNGFSGTKSQRLLATLHDDATFETTHIGTGSYVAALALYQVEGELVVRREGFGFASADAIASAYGFIRNWLPPVHGPG